MKKVILPISILLIGFAVLLFWPQPEQIDETGLTSICHFEGHEGDFVTVNAKSHPDGNPLCSETTDGIVLAVNQTNCETVHQANAVDAHSPTCGEWDSQRR